MRAGIDRERRRIREHFPELSTVDCRLSTPSPAAISRAREALDSEPFAGVSGLAAVGDFAAEVAAGAKEAGLSRSMITRDPEAAAAQVAEWSAPGDWILVKASRGVRLERAVEALQAKLK